MKLNKTLENYITSLDAGLDGITDNRIKILDSIVDYIRNSSNPKLNFICTHNSRRSHLGQIWAQTIAVHLGIEIETYSGGTEATSLHPNAISVLERAGFNIENPGGENPHYAVRFSSDTDPLICYSKKYDDEVNPQSNFAAIMTCSEADQECPVVFGASKRIKLLYEDPKVADGTDSEEETYDERCRQIATEMLYVFSDVS